MAKKITLEILAGMIKKGFDENTKEHKKIFAKFDENTKEHQQIFDRLDRIETKLENVVYRGEFDELKTRVEEIEELLAIQRKK